MQKSKFELQIERSLLRFFEIGIGAKISINYGYDKYFTKWWKSFLKNNPDKSITEYSPTIKEFIDIYNRYIYKLGWNSKHFSPFGIVAIPININSITDIIDNKTITKYKSIPNGSALFNYGIRKINDNYILISLRAVVEQLQPTSNKYPTQKPITNLQKNIHNILTSFYNPQTNLKIIKNIYEIILSNIKSSTPNIYKLINEDLNDSIDNDYNGDNYSKEDIEKIKNILKKYFSGLERIIFDILIGLIYSNQRAIHSQNFFNKIVPRIGGDVLSELSLVLDIKSDNKFNRELVKTFRTLWENFIPAIKQNVIKEIKDRIQIIFFLSQLVKSKQSNIKSEFNWIEQKVDEILSAYTDLYNVVLNIEKLTNILLDLIKKYLGYDRSINDKNENENVKIKINNILEQVFKSVIGEEFIYSYSDFLIGKIGVIESEYYREYGNGNELIQILFRLEVLGGYLRVLKEVTGLFYKMKYSISKIYADEEILAKYFGLYLLSIILTAEILNNRKEEINEKEINKTLDWFVGYINKTTIDNFFKNIIDEEYLITTIELEDKFYRGVNYSDPIKILILDLDWKIKSHITFILQGVSRILTHQFVRHKTALDFVQSSDRYNNSLKLIYEYWKNNPELLNSGIIKENTKLKDFLTISDNNWGWKLLQWIFNTFSSALNLITSNKITDLSNLQTPNSIPQFISNLDYYTNILSTLIDNNNNSKSKRKSKSKNKSKKSKQNKQINQIQTIDIDELNEIDVEYENNSENNNNVDINRIDSLIDWVIREIVLGLYLRPVFRLLPNYVKDERLRDYRFVNEVLIGCLLREIEIYWKLVREFKMLKEDARGVIGDMKKTTIIATLPTIPTFENFIELRTKLSAQQEIRAVAEILELYFYCNY